MLSRIASVVTLTLVTSSVIAQSDNREITPIHPKSITTDTLKIGVDRTQCRDWPLPLVVMNGDEADKSFKVTQDGDGSCRWTATRRAGNEIGRTFDTEFSQFSLRLGVARTNCKHAKPAGKSEATLTFRCCMPTSRNIRISTPSGMAISFVRGVPKTAFEPDSIDCVETPSFTTDPLEIESAWFLPVALSPTPPILADVFGNAARFENIWIQFNTAKADVTAPGLIINDRSVTKYLKNGQGSLTREQIASALVVQRSQGRAGMPPHCPPAAGDAYLEQFKRIELTRIDVTVAAK
jgi:hypothetical protein